MDAQKNWQLHPQLASDTASLGELPLSRLLVMNDRNYPWLILVPRRAGVTEIIDLADDDRTQLLAEITLASRALKDTANCDKLNIAAIGNMVPQLHIHIVARRRGDPAWPKPVWGAAPALPYDPSELLKFTETIKQQLKLA